MAWFKRTDVIVTREIGTHEDPLWIAEVKDATSLGIHELSYGVGPNEEQAIGNLWNLDHEAILLRVHHLMQQQ
jgi:hypothetical protein